MRRASWKAGRWFSIVRPERMTIHRLSFPVRLREFRARSGVGPVSWLASIGLEAFWSVGVTAFDLYRKYAITSLRQHECAIRYFIVTQTLQKTHAKQRIRERVVPQDHRVHILHTDTSDFDTRQDGMCCKGLAIGGRDAISEIIGFERQADAPRGICVDCNDACAGIHHGAKGLTGDPDVRDEMAAAVRRDLCAAAAIGSGERRRSG